jgi:phosphomannomutase
VCRGLTDSGVDVYDIGVCGTEGVYFATFDGGYDGGIMITASHNPPDYNGMKFVREQSKPISGDNGLQEIRAFAERGEFPDAAPRACAIAIDTMRGLHRAPAVVRRQNEAQAAENRGECRQRRRGPHHRSARAASAVQVHQGASRARRQFPQRHSQSDARGESRLHHRGDRATAPISASPGTATFDRCFLFDEHGGFIEGYYIVGLLASVLLRGQPGGKVVHDPRLTWNTIEIVEASGGVAVLSKSGHAFIKQRMREVDGVYGGEMSAHHYFRRFAYCDSGMIPWLLVAQIISESGQSCRCWWASASACFRSAANSTTGCRMPRPRSRRRAALRAAGASCRSHRRDVVRICRLALQSAHLEHRAA